jgi:hypothetical protein
MRPTLLLALLVLMAGCQETQHCAPGLFGRSCDQALMGQSDSGLNDGGMDAGTDDVGVDAFVPRDAGPCGEMCPRGEVCYEPAAGADAGHAAGCVECVTRADCAMRDGGISSDAGTRGALVCIDFECQLGCETSADCGAGGVCRADGTCSAYPAESTACAPCDTDANCATGLACFEYTARGHTGRYCLLASLGSCPASGAPFTRPLIGQSADDTTERTYCAPRAIVQTCEAFVDQQASAGCTDDSQCGLDLSDGFCVTFGSSPAACTYACTEIPVGSGVSPDCVNTDACTLSGTGRFCQRP